MDQNSTVTSRALSDIWPGVGVGVAVAVAVAVAVEIGLRVTVAADRPRIAGPRFTLRTTSP